MRELSEKARKLRNEYQRQYNNRPEVKEYMKKWRRHNRDKMRKYYIDFWERKAGNIPLFQQEKQLHREGLTQRQISEKLGISLGLANKYVNR